MGIIEVFKTFADMKKIGDFQKILTEACDALDKEGKLPADIKSFMDTMKNGNGDANSADNIAFIENGLKLFEQHSDLFDGKIEDIVKQYEVKAEELGKMAASLEKK
jgi:hypothetical protein